MPTIGSPPFRPTWTSTRTSKARLAVEASEREALEKGRAAIVVPAADTLGPMRRLGNDLAGARGALNVGLVVTVTPSRPIDIRAKKDGTAVRPAVTR